MTLKLLNDKYGIEEEDFLSAELEIVPAGKARELGMDASMILAYGQDDRVCAYTSLVAMLEVEAPEKTSGGKGGSNDANAEYVGALRAIFDDAKVNWQTAELGKVDVGGGGTIAYIMSLYGMEVIDSGVPVLSMHAPWEVTSKADIYEAKKAYVAFLKNA